MRVLKKISTPFMQVKPERALVIVNAVDPQINTMRAFIQACRDYKIHYQVFLNKVDRLEMSDVYELVKTLKEKLEIGDVTCISTKNETNMDLLKNQVKAWNKSRIIVLGVFNSGKTSIINWICKTNYRTSDTPGTTLEFTKTKFGEATIIDSVGQLIDIHKPAMVSIDFSECKNIDDKIARVFLEEIKGVAETSKSSNKNIILVIDEMKKAIKLGNKIITSGAGASALVAKEMAGQGTECGFPVLCFTNDGAECQPITFSKGIGESEGGYSRYIANAVNKGDIVIAVSASGGTGFIYDLLKRAIEKGPITVAITENSDTPMGKYADYILKSEAKPEGPSSSKIQTAHLVIGHTLMLVLADELGITADESVGYMLPDVVGTKKMGIK